METTISAIRLNRYLIVVLGLGLAAAAQFYLMDLSLLHGIAIDNVVIGRDFANAWLGGQALFQGNVDILYDIGGYFDFQREMLAPTVANHNFSYPPHTLFFLAPLAAFDYVPALLIWTAASLLTFYYAAKPYLVQAKIPPWVALILAGTLMNIWAGHYGLLLGAGLLSAWRICDGRPILAGILFGLLTIKPHMGVLIPVVLLCRRQWLAMAVAALTTATLVLASAAAFGWGVWETYLTDTREYQAYLLSRPPEFYHFMMPTVYQALHLAGLTSLAGLGQILSAVAVTAGVVWVSLRAASTQKAGLLAATGTFLVLPYAFNYDMTVVSLVALILGATYVAHGSLPEKTLLGGAAVAPAIVIFVNFAGVPVIPVFLFGLFVLQAKDALAEGKVDEPAGEQGPLVCPQPT